MKEIDRVTTQLGYESWCCQRARQLHFGTSARHLPGDDLARTADEDLQTQLTELQYLLDSWIDDFERDVFDGKTLAQMARGE